MAVELIFVRVQCDASDVIANHKSLDYHYDPNSKQKHESRGEGALPVVMAVRNRIRLMIGMLLAVSE